MKTKYQPKAGDVCESKLLGDQFMILHIDPYLTDVCIVMFPNCETTTISKTFIKLIYRP